MKSWLTSLVCLLHVLWSVPQRRCLLITRYGGMGDVLCLLPAVAQWRARHPGLPLVFITGGPQVELVRLSGLADLVLPSDAKGLGFMLRQWLRPEVEVKPLLPDEVSPPRPCGRRHLAAEFAEALDVPFTQTHLPMAVPAKALRALQRTLSESFGAQRVAVVHPGPSWEVREWPVEGWQQLVQRLLNRGLTVIQIGTRHGNARLVDGPQEALAGAVDWRDRLDVGQLLALLSLAVVFVGIDSGPLHLAAVTGIALVGIFGPVDAACRLPQRATAIAVHGDAACVPCHHDAAGPRHWRSGCPNQIACMKELSVDRVMVAVEEALAQGKLAA
jgi:ADP-heptose:LPS heptosyltransferase